MLNDLQISEEDFIVKQAGASSVVTVATNAAGRGTDIPISKLAMQNGGLHVIFTFFPSNQRIEDQGAGRAGRQGNNGSYRIIVPYNDAHCLKIQQENVINLSVSQLLDIMIDYVHDKPDEINNVTAEKLITYRTNQVQQESKNRILQSQLNLAQHTVLEEFCSWYHSQLELPKFNKDAVLMKWAEFYTNLENIAFDDQSNSSLITNTHQLDKYKAQLAKQFKEFCKDFTSS